MRSTWQRMAVGLVAAFGLAVFTGCGSSSSDSGSANAAPGADASSAPSTTAAPASGESIKLGNIGRYSGAEGASAIYTQTLLKRWQDEVNASGGINGHPVEVTSIDDGGDANKALAAARTLVEDKKVIGMVAAQVPTTAAAIAPYLQKKGIPVVGGDVSVPTWYENPMFFAQAPKGPAFAYAIGQILKQQKASKLGIWTCNLGEPCQSGIADLQAVLPDVGVNVVNRQEFGLDQANYQANCLAAQKAGVQALEVVSNPTTSARVISSCDRLGYNPLFLILNSTQVGNPFRTLSAKARVAGVQGWFPWFLTSGTPALDEWGKVTKGAPEAAIGGKIAGSWVAIKLAQKALAAGVPKGGTPTTSGLLDGLYGLKDETLGGLSIPLNFERGKPSPLGSCWFNIEYINSKFEAPHNTEAQCAPPNALKAPTG